MSKLGTLQQIQENTVQIDEVFYDATNVSKYLPQQTGIQVEYNADENNQLLFIREKKAGGFSGKGSFTPKNTQGGPGSKKKQYYEKNTDSIIKQVLFKGGIELNKKFTHSSVGEALATLKELYDGLKEEYFNELK